MVRNSNQTADMRECDIEAWFEQWTREKRPVPRPCFLQREGNLIPRTDEGTDR